MFKKLAILFVVVITNLLTSATSAVAVQFESHDIYLTIDVENQSATIVDNAVVDLKTGQCSFLIPRNAKELNFTVDGHFCEHLTREYIRPVEDSVDQIGLLQNLPPGMEVKIVTFDVVEDISKRPVGENECVEAGKHELEVRYTAKFDDFVENVRFSSENVGREISGTILDKGAYLSPSSFYYPQSEDGLASFSITVNIPADWESVADGNRVSSKIEGDRKIQKWTNPYQSDGLMFFAAPFVRKSAMADSIEVACYFFEEDTSLIEGYLEATLDYIRMYNSLIGTYPYKRFTVAENFFPTGYGMPAWTLLGQQVLRLPFIKATSLGHEVLHNWWGNSVYVDYARGNWCESATVYGADYRYKLMESEDAARDYRKNILKQYNSYVNEGNDFAIREFTSRTSPNTRTIGYNKAMMVWHLINELIGDEAFFGAWKDIYREYIGKSISWEEWIAALEKRCDCDLSFVLHEWIDRPGAPQIGLEILHSKVANNRLDIEFRLTQSGDNLYTLALPIYLDDQNLGYDTVVNLSTVEQVYNLSIPGTFTSLIVDPDFHIFRSLYPSEIEPIVSGVLGEESQHFATGELSDEMTLAAQDFFRNVSGSDSVSALPLAHLPKGRDNASMIVIDPNYYPDYLTDLFVDDGDTVYVDGIGYPRKGHTFVLAAQNWLYYDKCLLIVSDDTESLPRIGQLVPHYGKYSYLVFEGASNVAKGQWPVLDSPLSLDF